MQTISESPLFRLAFALPLVDDSGQLSLTVSCLSCELMESLECVCATYRYTYSVCIYRQQVMLCCQLNDDDDDVWNLLVPQKLKPCFQHKRINYGMPIHERSTAPMFLSFTAALR